MAKMYKIDLPVVGKSGPASKKVLAEVQEEYAVFDEKGELPKHMQERQKSRGELLDYRQTLLSIVRRPKNPNSAMGYAEFEEVRETIAALKEAKSGGHVLLESAAYDALAEKVRQPIVAAYSELFDEFCQAVLNAEKVDVGEVKEDARAD